MQKTNRNPEAMTHGNKIETYEEFIEKFKRKPTTDDCFTPPEIYEKIKDYFCDKFHIDQASIIRPFYPGGDYEHEDYTGKVVLDNPPFSKSSKIVHFYQERGIPFILFCNALTALGLSRRTDGLGYIFVKCSIRYENGALVKTAFVTNLTTDIIQDGVLSELIHPTTPRIKTPRPDHVLTSADCCKCKEGQITRIEHWSYYRGDSKHKLYGGAIHVDE